MKAPLDPHTGGAESSPRPGPPSAGDDADRGPGQSGGCPPRRPPAAQGGIMMVLMFGGAGLNLLFMVFTGARLGSEEAGVFYAALYLSFWLCTSLSAVNGTVTRYTSLVLTLGHPGYARRLVVLVARWTLLAGGILGLGYLLLGGELNRALRFSSGLVLPAVLAIFLTQIWLALARGSLRGRQRFAAYGMSFLVENLARVGVVLAVIDLAPTTSTAMASFWAGTASAAAYALWAARGLPRGQAAGFEAHVPVAELRRYLALMAVMVAVCAGFQNLDVLLARRYFTGPDVGGYGAAATLAKAVEVINMWMVGVLLPVLTAAFARGRSLARPFLRQLGLFAALAAIPLVGSWLAPAAIIRLFYGVSFVAGAPFLWPQTLSALLTGLALAVCQIYNAIGRFGFLVFFAAGLALEFAAVAVYHPSLMTMIWVVCAVKAVTLVAMSLPLLSKDTRPGLQ